MPLSVYVGFHDSLVHSPTSRFSTNVSGSGTKQATSVPEDVPTTTEKEPEKTAKRPMTRTKKTTKGKPVDKKG